MNECVTVNQEARKSAAIREDGAPKLLTMGSTRVRVGGLRTYLAALSTWVNPRTRGWFDRSAIEVVR